MTNLVNLTPHPLTLIADNGTATAVKDFDINVWFDQMLDIEEIADDADLRDLCNWAMTTLGDTSLPLDMALRLAKNWPSQMQELWGYVLQAVPAAYALNAMRVITLGILQYTAETLNKVRG